MLPTRELAGTEVTTSAVGFGCAGLYRIPQLGGRRSALDAAFEAGIRHFDVAPMYGLGLAEAELSQFLRRRRSDVTVTTKFGIEPTLLSKGIARVQKPARAFLAKRPNASEELKRAGRGPRSGSLGRLLYASPGYGREAAQAALERSLRALRTDHIDVFLLHDPARDLIIDAPDLVEFMDEQRRLGRIRCWGVTGRPSDLPGLMQRIGQTVVAQFRDDIFDPPLSDGQLPDGGRITYGALAGALPLMRRLLAQSPGATHVWSQRLGVDLNEESALPSLLLRAALRRNPAGPVLFTTTRPERMQVAAEAATQSRGLSDAELTMVGEFAAASRLLHTEMVGTS